MGAHSSAESLMAGVESDSLRYRAASYSMIIDTWLAIPVGQESPLDGMPADAVEIMRNVRDVLWGMSHA